MREDRTVNPTTPGRITIDPSVMGGQPCVRGLRMPVASVMAMLGDGMTEAEILVEHPELESDDLAACVEYAAREAGGSRRPGRVASESNRMPS